MTFCINCGQQIVEGSKFCAECGTMVSGTNQNNKRQAVYDGVIHKCPNCGEDLPSFTTVCPSCHYELRGSQSSTSLKEFSLKLEKAFDNSAKINLIRHFPIPNTREDIREFMILALTNVENSYHEELLEAWSVIFEQAFEKAHIIYGDSDDFIRCRELFIRKKKQSIKKYKSRERKKEQTNRATERRKYREKNKEQRTNHAGERRRYREKNKERRSKFFEKNKEYIILFVSLLLLILPSIGHFGFSSLSHLIRERKLNKLTNQVEELIDNNDFKTARLKANQIIYDSYGSSDTKKKWENIKYSLLERIDEAEGVELSKIKVSYTQNDFIGLNYEEVEEKLKLQGFVNIKFEEHDDLIIGFLTKKGEVEKVSIDGNTDFEKNSCYMPNVEIIITYHTF